MQALVHRWWRLARWLGAAAALAAPLAAAAAHAVVTTPQVRAELVAHAPQGLGPGLPMWLGLSLQHQPHWHTYWQNPGDSGMATTLAWTLPAGAAAGEVAWPLPVRLPIGPLLNYGYEGTLLLPVPLRLTAPLDAPALRVALHAEWLVCRVECIPQSGDFELDVPVEAATGAHRPDFERAWAAHPAASPTLQAEARIEQGALAVQVRGLDAALRGRTATVFPELAGVVENAAPVSQAWQGDLWQARWPLAAQRSESPPSMPLVLGFDGGPALRVQAQVQGAWPGEPAPARSGTAGTAGAAASPAASPPMTPMASLGFVAALGLALLGGAILNLMPCVFPVLALKALALAQHGHDARARWLSALAYGVGVLLSFLALAALLLAVRAGGQHLGWGFQLQSPAVVAALALLFTLIGLNLAGVFEFGSVLPSGLAGLRARHPAVDAGLTGVLAVAVASPCTAPFMGAALGAALTWPPVQALAVFAALGLGMALPYGLLSVAPAATRWLPRPGAWMQRLKVALAFPMFATVVWLTWVLGQQTGIDGAAALLAVLVLAALAAWLWSLRPLQGLGRGLLALCAAALLAVGWAWAAPFWREAGEAAEARAQTGWEPWSAPRLAELRAQGRAVFVDFTAAWCVTCQFNKRGTLADAGLLAELQARHVVLLRADWTARDPAIGAELARLNRSGVPTYVLYRGDAAPQVLGEILTVDEVRSAISSLTSGALP
ncbi:MAG TPA: thioredoxin family protein [Burkholderiaceae bacterium]|nr:thioredoxin family protein [Burkholderiaceae bacterium]